MHKREIRELYDAVRQKGMTIIPVKIYLKDGRAKLDLAMRKVKSSMINGHRLPIEMHNVKWNESAAPGAKGND